MDCIERARAGLGLRRTSTPTRYAPVLAALAALASTAAAQNAAVVQSRSPPDPSAHTVTLGALGYPDGLSLRQPSGAVTVYFPAPIDARVQNARIGLRLAGGALKEQGAFLQLEVNGRPRATVSLADAEVPGGTEYVLPLTPQDLGKPFLTLGLYHRFDPRHQFCIEEDSGAFLNVGSDSYFAYTLPAGAPTSLRGWFSTLPAGVTVGVEGDSPKVLKAAWFIANELRRQGHVVRFVAATHEAIGEARILVSEAPLSSSGAPADNAPLRLLTPEGAQSVLAVLAGDELALIADDWRALLTQPVSVPARVQFDSSREGRELVALTELGLDARPLDAVPSIEWHASVAAKRLPAGRAPLRVFLDIIAAPALEGEPALLFSYLDGRLIQSDRLNADGRRQRLVIDLEDRLGDDLRLLVRYYPKRQQCEAPRAGLPVQILPESYLELETARALPERFDQVSAYWRPGMRLNYDQTLPVPARLALLTSLSDRFGLSPALLELALIGSGPVQNGDVVWLSHTAPPGTSGPVRLDRGRLRVEDARGGTVLDSAEIPGVGVWQILHKGDQRLLWIYPSASDRTLDHPQALQLGPSNVAFLANGEVLLQLDSSQAELTRIAYPEYRGWRTFLQQYRYWLFAFAWILLTLGVVALYRRIRGARKRT